MSKLLRGFMFFFLFYTNLYFWLLGSQDELGLWLKNGDRLAKFVT